MGLFHRITKRAFDLIGATTAMVATAPVMALAAAASRAEVGAPALIRVLRAGRRGEPFAMWQLRTHATTELGAWLRATAIEQLPALWNVVRGEMSLVGPRPVHPQYAAMAPARLGMKPGLVGWAQLHRDRARSWEDEQVLDAWYLDHASLTVDCLIVARAVIDRVRRPEVGASSGPDAVVASERARPDAILN